MENTKQHLLTIKLIREGLETHLLYQRNFNAAMFPNHSTDWARADTRLDGLRETITMVTRLQLDLERELANESTLKRVHTDAPTD